MLRIHLCSSVFIFVILHMCSIIIVVVVVVTFFNKTLTIAKQHWHISIKEHWRGGVDLVGLKPNP